MAVRMLPANIINRIAAGEVLERPASAIKELVENALDAGARSIAIQIGDGGRALLRVVDDGSGMGPEDLELAVERHATSKLHDEQLVDIETLGFRGEALATIGAVARMAITTRREEDPHAWSISVDGGEKSALRPASHPRGTTVEVRDVFFATPARLKFLKSERTESANILDTVRRLALARPDVAFSLSNDGRSSLRLPALPDAGAGSLLARAVAILGQEFADNALALDVERDGRRLRGLVSLPTYNRATPDQQYLFVQGRAVRDRQLLSAVRAGFEDTCPRDRHPVVCLFLDVPHAEVDVNAHPAKAEVRFRDSQSVRGLFVTAIRHALMGAAGRRSAVTGGLAESFRMEPAANGADGDTPAALLSILGERSAASNDDDMAGSLPDGTPWRPTPALTYPPAAVARSFPGPSGARSGSYRPAPYRSDFRPYSPDGVGSWSRDDQNDASAGRGIMVRVGASGGEEAGSDLPGLDQEVFPASETRDAVPAASAGEADCAAWLSGLPGMPEGRPQPLGRAVGQIHQSFIVAETADGLVLIDQHAAHERIVYEKLKREFLDRGVAAQGLLVPEIVEMDEASVARLVDWAGDLARLGLVIEPFGSEGVLVRSVPALLGTRIDARAMLRDLADQIATDDDPAALRRELHHLLATLACHTSIRAGRRLSLPEMDALLRQMEETDLTGQCNHGRPTQASLSLGDIRRLFERS